MYLVNGSELETSRTFLGQHLVKSAINKVPVLNAVPTILPKNNQYILCFEALNEWILDLGSVRHESLPFGQIICKLVENLSSLIWQYGYHQKENEMRSPKIASLAKNMNERRDIWP